LKGLTAGELFNTFQHEKLKSAFGPEIYIGECWIRSVLTCQFQFHNFICAAGVLFCIFKWWPVCSGNDTVVVLLTSHRLWHSRRLKWEMKSRSWLPSN